MVTLVTLTGFADIFDQFQRNIETREPGNPNRIVVTSRGLQPKFQCPDLWKTVEGVEPFIFARNANIGIRAANPISDILLINDDTQLITHGAMKILEEVANTHPCIGLLSPTIMGSVGNRLQNLNSNCGELTFSEYRLAFVCVYIKRSLINTIGLLDEQFDGYGGDDDDYSYRAVRAGFHLAITRKVIVQHGHGIHKSSSSFARTHVNNAQSMAEMRRKLMLKWKDELQLPLLRKCFNVQ